MRWKSKSMCWNSEWSLKFEVKMGYIQVKCWLYLYIRIEKKKKNPNIVASRIYFLFASKHAIISWRLKV